MPCIAGIVAAVATGPATLAWAYRKVLPAPLTFTLAHIAVAGYLVALASSDVAATQSTWLLGKRADGSIHPLNLAAMWPYHVGLRCKLWIQRRVSTEPHYTLITPGFYIGGWPSSEKWLPSAEQLAVVDCTCELPRRHALPYLLVPTWDTHGPDPVLVEQAVQWAMEQRRANRTVLVHCAHGHGRSTVVLCAALVEWGYAKTFQEAFDKAKLLRPRIKLNARQRRSLEAWSLVRTRKL